MQELKPFDDREEQRKEKARQHAKQYYLAHHDTILASKRDSSNQYYQTHRETINATRREKLRVNNESINEMRRKYYRENCEKIIERERKYREANSQKINERRRKHSKIHIQERKLQAFAVFGGKCVRCGFTDPRALQLDHIDGGGSKERHNGFSGMTPIYNKIIRGNTQGYQLLCANCNWIKRFENGEHRNRLEVKA